MNQDVYVMDVIWRVVSAMQVQIYGKPVGQFFTINFNPGRNEQIVTALENADGTTLMGLKYPMCAVKMPFTIKSGSGFYEVKFPEIVFAYLTQTNEGHETVLQKYNLSGNFKTVLYPCANEFIKRLAWSTFTSQGDPDVYPFSLREFPGQFLASKINDSVDILKIVDLEAIIYPQIKTC